MDLVNFGGWGSEFDGYIKSGPKTYNLGPTRTLTIETVRGTGAIQRGIVPLERFLLQGPRFPLGFNCIGPLGAFKNIGLGQA